MNITVSSEGNQARRSGVMPEKYNGVAPVPTHYPPRGRFTGQAGNFDLDSIVFLQAGAVQLMG